MPMADLLAERDGAFGAAVDSTLLARLDLKLGDRITIGNASFQIRSVVVAEPDKLAGNVGLGPRVLVSEASLRASGLLQPGSLVRWMYRVKLPDNAADDRAATQLIDSARSALPEAGWWIRSSSNASPQLERTINRFTQFLTLVGLAALLVGGVGVANAVKSHIDRRRDVIASFKALGATGRDVFTIYLTQVILLAAVGSVIGLAAGAALPFLIVGVFGKLLPLPVIPALHVDELALSFVYGLLTALAFGLWPLGRVHDVPVAALFREEVAREWHRPRWSYLALMAVVIALLVAVAIGLAYDKRVAAVFVVSSVAVFALLRGVAAGLMALARRMPRSRITMLRLAIANIYRPGALTPSVVMSLGLGLAVLVTITQIDGNLRRQFLAALPEKAPSFYFIDIPTADADRFGAFLKQVAPQSTIEDVPMLRGRIVAARGVKADELKPSQDSEWVLQSDRGLTYTGEVPKGSKVVEGEWWSRRLYGTTAGIAGEEDRRRPETQDRATTSWSTCSAAIFRPGSAICATSTGRGSASISCWYSRPTRSRARRTAMSRPFPRSIRTRPATPGSSSRWRTPSRWSPACGSARRWKPSAPSSPTSCSPSAAPAR